MADDLADEWWLSSGKQTKGVSSDDEASDDDRNEAATTKSKTGKKAKKLEATASKKRKKSESEDTTADAKKRKSEGKRKGEKSEKSKTKKKRKAEREKENGVSLEEPSPVKKKKKQSKDSKVADDDDDDDDAIESDSSENPVTSEFKKKKCNRRRISDMLAKTVPKAPEHTELVKSLDKFFGDKLSPVEVDEITLSEKNFASPRVADLSDTVAEYLQEILPRWNKQVKAMSDTPGAPLLLVITSAATRAVDFIRDLKKFHFGKCKVAKLFAKHMKLKEQTKFLNKTAIHIGVGTPGRISALLDNEVLKLDQTVLILMDWSWRNVKLRRLVDIPDVVDELFPLLQKHLIPRVNRGKCKLALL